MAKRFSAKRLKPSRNLTGKRQEREGRVERVKKDDLFGIDEPIAPKIVNKKRPEPKPYVTQSQRQMLRDMEMLAKEQGEIAPKQAAANEGVADIWGPAPARRTKKRPASLAEKLTFELPDSSQSYNPDEKLHEKALDLAAREILEENIERSKREANKPRIPTKIEEQTQSIAIFQQLAGAEYEKVQVLPVSIEKAKLDYEAHRQETLRALETYERLKEQIDQEIGRQTLSADTLANYALLRREMYRDFEAQIPEIEIKKCKNQRDEIQQFIDFYTPEKIEEVIKMKQILELEQFIGRNQFERIGKLFEADYPLLEAEELGTSLKNTRTKGSPFHDQLNSFVNRRIIHGHGSSRRLPRLARYNLAFKWWAE